MRKTKKLHNTIKTLCLIFAVCFLAATQSIAQSNSGLHHISKIEIQEYNTVEQFKVWNIFDWFRIIVTTDMSVLIPGKSEEISTSAEYERRIIVTTDMSVREGKDEN